MKYFIVLVPAVVIGFIGFLAVHLGAFKSVTIAQENKGPYIMLYKDFTGPYHKTVSVITEVEQWAFTNKVDCRLSFGEYKDDPEKVEEARLKSRGGCLTEKVPANLPADFKTEELPEKSYVTAVFEGSPGIGPMKVYPKVNEYMTQKGLKQNGPVIEVYEIHSRTENNSMTTTYLFPI